NNPQKLTLPIYYGKNIPFGMYNIRFTHVGRLFRIKHYKIVLYNIPQFHHAQYRPILILIRNEVSRIGKHFSINGMFHPITVNQIRYGTNNHQGHHQGITARDLRYEEKAGQWGMHDTAQGSCHSCHDEIRNIQLYDTSHIDSISKSKA